MEFYELIGGARNHLLEGDSGKLVQRFSRLGLQEQAAMTDDTLWRNRGSDRRSDRWMGGRNNCLIGSPDPLPPSL